MCGLWIEKWHTYIVNCFGSYWICRTIIRSYDPIESLRRAKVSGGDVCTNTVSRTCARHYKACNVPLDPLIQEFGVWEQKMRWHLLSETGISS